MGNKNTNSHKNKNNTESNKNALIKNMRVEAAEEFNVEKATKKKKK